MKKMAPCAFLFVTILVLPNVINAQSEIQPIRDCGPNAVWTPCQSLCSPSCDSINNPNPIRCYSYLCRPGCNCMQGYIRKSENSVECILEEQCPRIATPKPHRRCGRFAEWSDCASYCPPNCKDLQSPDPIMCPAVCVKGCTCIQGYIRRNLRDPNCYPNSICPVIRPSVDE